MAHSQIQEQISKLWAQSLGVKAVAPQDNFFAIGGHSLLGVKLMAAVQQKLGLDAELSLSDLLEHPTLSEFCDHIAALCTSDQDTGLI